MSGGNFVLSFVELEKSFINSGPKPFTSPCLFCVRSEGSGGDNDMTLCSPESHKCKCTNVSLAVSYEPWHVISNNVAF